MLGFLLLLAWLAYWAIHYGFRHAVVVRVPVLAAFVLAVGPIWFGDTVLTNNLFVIERWWGLGLAAGGALVLAWSCGQAWSLIAEHAAERFDDIDEFELCDALKPARIEDLKEGRGWNRAWFFVLLAAPSVVIALLRSPVGPGGAVAGLAVGVGLAASILGLQWCVRRWIGKPKEGRGRFAWLATRHARGWPLLWRGYVKSVDSGEPRHEYLAGHLGAVAGLISLVLFFAVFSWAFSPVRSWGDHVPALFYLWFVLVVVVSAFSGVTFFGDRGRFPLLLLLFVLAWVGRTPESSDHYFRTLRPKKNQLPPPAAAETVANAESVVVVCAAGGGIQAAGWTAKVLTELHRQPGFAPGLRLISGVSGGSVGSMFYVEALRRRNGTLNDSDLGRVFDAATTSSLGAVGWGVAFQDTRRWIPFLASAERDRAWALEQRWRRSLDLGDGEVLDSTLGDWAQAVRAKRIPAVVFNATFMQGGRRLLFGTVTIEETGAAAGARDPRLNFFDLYGRDVPVVTAVRASASFPFVSPLARAADESYDGLADRTWYLADGGYFDNLGVVTAVDWILAVAPRVKRVALVQILAFPPPAPGAPGAPATGVARRLRNATVGPLEVVLAARTSTQVVRGQLDVDLLRSLATSRRLQVRAVRRLDVKQRMEATGSREEPTDYPTVDYFLFAPRKQTDAPLSWHLSPDQIEQIRSAWPEPENQAELTRLAEWLNR